MEIELLIVFVIIGLILITGPIWLEPTLSYINNLIDLDKLNHHITWNGELYNPKLSSKIVKKYNFKTNDFWYFLKQDSKYVKLGNGFPRHFEYTKEDLMKYIENLQDEKFRERVYAKEIRYISGIRRYGE